MTILSYYLGISIEVSEFSCFPTELHLKISQNNVINSWCLSQRVRYAELVGNANIANVVMRIITKNEASKYGLLINESKTKYMKCTRKQVRENKLEIDNMSFESVQSFKYII
jgi:hypothetical protein